MKPSEIYRILDLAKRINTNGKIWNPAFVGAPGLGKTEIVQQWCEERNLPFVVLTSALLEAPDVRGYPLVEVVNGRQRQKTAHPEFWPDEGQGVIILEEFNRGQTSIMNCWMSLTDKRRGFDNYKLPDGWMVVGCINPEDGNYDTNNMDPALKDRFEFFNVNYDKASFVDYMRVNDWNESLRLWVESGTWTYTLPEKVGNDAGSKYLSPRTLSKLNAALEAKVDADDEQMIYESILGANMGKSFHHFKYNDYPVSIYDLKNNHKASIAKLKLFADPANYKSAHISITMKSIVDDATIEDGLLSEVLLTIGADQANALVKELNYKREKLTGEKQDILARIVDAYPAVKKYFKMALRK